jgi:RNA polymerase sigma factor (sigma-70 family)
MSESNDHELLAEFVRSGSETAFAELVARHVNLVYSAALRFSGNPSSAEEITQAVFTILARKAGKLSPRIALSGWLYQTARLTAANYVKGEIRRQQREQEAYMQSTLNETDAVAWAQIAPLLDEAMGHLGATDRNAVVLRFFENKTAAEVATALQLTEAAAHKRVSRALEKLRKIFTKRGVTLSATLIAGVVSANSVQAAPVGLAVTVTAALAQGTSISATITTLVKGTMKTMTWLKLKFAIGVGVAALLTGGMVTVAVSQTGGGDKLTAQEIVKKSHTAYATLASYSDSGTVVYEMAGQKITTTFHTRLQRPNRYRIDWDQTTSSYSSKGVVWSDGSGDYLQIAAPDFLAAATGQKKNDKLQKMPNLKTALALATPLSGSAASTIPGIFFSQNLGDFAAPAASGSYPLKKENDAIIGGVDCYVVSSGMIDLSKVHDIGKSGTVSTMFWIGKEDFLIHQCRTKYVEKVDASATDDQAVDEAIKKSLEMQHQPVTPEAVAAMRPQMKEIMKQVQSTLKSGFESGVVSTQTHDHTVVNPKFSPADFAR